MSWGEDVVPRNMAGNIIRVEPEVGGTIILDNYSGFSNPATVGRDDAVEADLAFASVKRGVRNPGGELTANFYMPMMQRWGGDASGRTITLTPAENVMFGDKSLATFCGASRP